MLNDAFHVVDCYLPEETKLFKAHYVENHGKSAGTKLTVKLWRVASGVII